MDDSLLTELEREGLCHQYKSPILTELLFFNQYNNMQHYAAYYFCSNCRAVATCRQYWEEQVNANYDYGVWFGTTSKHRKKRRTRERYLDCYCEHPDLPCLIHTVPPKRRPRSSKQGDLMRLQIEKAIRDLTGSFHHGKVVEYPRSRKRKSQNVAG